MGVKISELQEKTTSDNTDVIPIVDTTGGTKKITKANLLKEIDDKFTNLSNYSAQEIDTGKTWIDGKKIYRKVVTLTTSTEQQTIAHNIANVENIWIAGDSFFSIDEISIPANYYRDSGIYAYTHVNKNNILFRVSPARMGKSQFVCNFRIHKNNRLKQIK